MKINGVRTSFGLGIRNILVKNWSRHLAILVRSKTETVLVDSR